MQQVGHPADAYGQAAYPAAYGAEYGAPPAGHPPMGHPPPAAAPVAPYGAAAPYGAHPHHGPPMAGYERVLPCVKLRGLPFDISEDDVRMFLGMEPVDILLVKRGGRFSGEAYVVLPDLMQVDMAIAKDKSYLGKRYVEVFRAKKMDYYKAVAAQFNDYGDYPGAPPMMMRGPPPMGMPPRGPPMYGYGYGPAAGAPPQREFTAASEGIMKLRGLPFSATKQDICDWFAEAGVTIAQERITICIDHDGRPSGIAFADFGAPEAAQAGMVKDRQMMGSRYIELFPSSREELERYSANAR